MRLRGLLKRAGIVVLVGALIGVAALALFLRATIFAPRDAVVDSLPALPSSFALGDLRLPAQGRLPALDPEAVAQSGRGTLVICCDPNSFGDPAALHWVSALGEMLDYARDRSGRADVFGVVSSPKMPAWLQAPPIALMGKSRTEFPMEFYLDFGRVFGGALALPKGQVAVVMISNSREVTRLAGEPDAEKLVRVREFLGVPSSPISQRAPDLARFSGLETIAAGTPVAICFLAKSVTAKSIPKMAGSPLALLLSGLTPPDDPDVRMLTFFAHAEAPKQEAPFAVVIVGEATGFEEKKWLRVGDDGAVRAAFGIAAGESALVLVDREGALRVCAKGLVPMWRLGQVGDLLGIPPPGN